MTSWSSTRTTATRTWPGVVNGLDYARIDAGYLSRGALTGWYNGDFNYDGKVDASDYTLIDNAFNTQAGNLSTSVGMSAASAAEIAPVLATSGQVFGTSAGVAAPAAVPEPTGVAVAAIAVGRLAGRRRARRDGGR